MFVTISKSDHARGRKPQGPASGICALGRAASTGECVYMMTCELPAASRFFKTARRVRHPLKDNADSGSSSTHNPLPRKRSTASSRKDSPCSRTPKRSPPQAWIYRTRFRRPGWWRMSDPAPGRGPGRRTPGRLARPGGPARYSDPLSVAGLDSQAGACAHSCRPLFLPGPSGVREASRWSPGNECSGPHDGIAD
jgi:hypothetical protein